MCELSLQGTLESASGKMLKQKEKGLKNQSFDKVCGGWRET
jgi:hypothetical protein